MFALSDPIHSDDNAKYIARGLMERFQADSVWPDRFQVTVRASRNLGVIQNLSVIE
jgi:hypothetical protein